MLLIAADLQNNGDGVMMILPHIIRIIQNYLLNLTHKSHLIKGYIFRVYVSKEYIDKKDYDPILDDDHYLYGDFPAGKQFAPVVKKLFVNYLTEKQREEIREFFVAYNTLAEDWLLQEGAEKILLTSENEMYREDGEMLLKLKRQISAMEEYKQKNGTTVDDKDLSDELFRLLEDIRDEYIKVRDLRVAQKKTYILPPSTQSTQLVATGNNKKKVDLKKDKEKKAERKQKAHEILTVSSSEEEDSVDDDEPKTPKSKAIKQQLKPLVNAVKVAEKATAPPIIVAKNTSKVAVTNKKVQKKEDSSSSDSEKEDKKPLKKPVASGSKPIATTTTTKKQPATVTKKIVVKKVVKKHETDSDSSSASSSSPSPPKTKKVVKKVVSKQEETKVVAKKNVKK